MFGKLWKWLGLADVEEEADEQPEQVPFMFSAPGKTSATERIESLYSSSRTESSPEYEQLVTAGNSGINIAVIQPQHFEDSQRAVDYIKRNQQVVLDCSQSPAEVSRRVIDFLSGAVYAVNGQAKPVGNGVFIFVPANTEVE